MERVYHSYLCYEQFKFHFTGPNPYLQSALLPTYSTKSHSDASLSKISSPNLLPHTVIDQAMCYLLFDAQPQASRPGIVLLRAHNRHKFVLPCICILSEMTHMLPKLTLLVLGAFSAPLPHFSTLHENGL